MAAILRCNGTEHDVLVGLHRLGQFLLQLFDSCLVLADAREQFFHAFAFCLPALHSIAGRIEIDPGPGAFPQAGRP